MTTRLFVVVGTLIGCLAACQPDRRASDDRVRDEAASSARAAQREAESARAAIARRLDKLDDDIEKLDDRAEKATGKTKAKLQKESRELRAEARKLRDRMSTWDEKVESAWRASKREVEEGLDKTEDALKKLRDDIKD